MNYVIHKYPKAKKPNIPQTLPGIGSFISLTWLPGGDGSLNSTIENTDATANSQRKKMTIVTKKDQIETRINLFVSIKKSAVASMIAIAVSNDFR